MNNKRNDYILIENENDLKDVVNILKSEKSLAVDLEADSMYHFKEKVCLVQIANSSLTAVIDTLQVQDLSLMKPLFLDKDIQKNFHGSDYDVRSLYRDFGIEINNLFDTELASRFLGVRETGLGAVLSERFNISLDKKYQKKDWSQRPLPKGMMDYGAKDVIYLLPLADILKEELLKKGRYSWVTEECEYLSKVRPGRQNEEPYFLKVRGAGRLGPRSLAVLEALLSFRIKRAKHLNRPPFKVIKNTILLTLSSERPKTMKALKRLNVLSQRQIHIYGEGILNSIENALSMPNEKLPHYPHKRAPRLRPSVVKRIKKIKEWRDHQAEALEIDPSLLFNKALIISIAKENPHTLDELRNVDGVRNWHVDTFGEMLIQILKTTQRR